MPSKDDAMAQKHRSSAVSITKVRGRLPDGDHFDAFTVGDVAACNSNFSHGILLKSAICGFYELWQAESPF